MIISGLGNVNISAWAKVLLRQEGGPAREELITFTKRKLERLAIVRRVMKRELKQKVAAELLDLSTRQVRNLVRKVERDGARGLAHGNRGKPSPKRLAQTLVDKIVTLVKVRYPDFKPKFAAEKLWKRDKIRVSDEKMRQIMIGAGLWHVHRQARSTRGGRRPNGEMVQMDGSHHAWLEARPKTRPDGHGGRCAEPLLRCVYAYEGVYPAMNVLEGYIRRFGLLSYTLINTALIRRFATLLRMSSSRARRLRPSSSGPPKSWG